MLPKLRNGLSGNGVLKITAASGNEVTLVIDKGVIGPQGPAGEGVPTGGLTGQVLTKVSDANYDTQWLSLSGLNYQGTWNASTNTPTLVSSVGLAGGYYIVNVAGNTNLNGVTDWKVNDWAVFNGTVWQKIDNTDSVTSVNGQTGAVNLTPSDIGSPSYIGTGANGIWGISITGNAATADNATNSVNAQNAQTANSATTAVNVSGVVGIANGGTGSTTAADARTSLDVPSSSGSGATGTWGISVTGTANKATNIVGGVAGSLPYQTALTTTALLPIGAANRIMTSSGSAPQWSDPSFVTVGKAYDIMGGGVNEILFQNGTDSTHYISAPTVGDTYLKYDGTNFVWATAGGGSSLIGTTSSTSPFETSLGVDAGLSNTGVNNTYLGYGSGRLMTGATNNVVIGHQAMDAATIPSSCVVIGASAAGATTGASNTVVIGHLALGTATSSGGDCVYIGQSAGSACTGGGNILIGSLAGNACTTLQSAVGIGTGVFATTTAAATGLVAIGHNALGSLTSGASNTAIGYLAGTLVSTGGSNTLIGTNAGKAITTASNITCVGGNAGAVVTGATNTLIGSNAGLVLTTGQSNTVLGNNAGAAMTTPNNNTFIGASAGDQATTLNDAVAVGKDAIGSVATSAAAGAIAIGSGALVSLTTGAAPTVIGYQAGSALTTGNYNTIIGYQAGQSITTGEGSTFIGHNAGKLATGSFNTVVGHFAGDGITTGTSNCVIGWNAGGGLTTGQNNILLGTSAGANISTGSSNTIIGGYTGIAGMMNQTVLSDGTGTIRLQFNLNGAMSFDGNNYGTTNQILRSRGSGATPIWVDESAAPFSIVSTNTTCTSDKEVYMFDCTSNNLIATLPDATANSGQVVIIKRFDDNAATQLDVQTTGGQLIDGVATSDVINRLNAVTYIAAASGWHILNVYNSTTPSLASPIVQSTMGGDGDAFITFTPVEGATGYDVLVDPNGN